MFDFVKLMEQCGKAAGADVSLATDAELLAAVEALMSARAAFDAVEGHVLAELEGRGVCDREFGLSTPSWVAWHTGVSRSAVAGRLRVSVRLRTLLTETDDALAAGRVSFDDARVLVAAANPRIEAAIAELQGELVGLAERVSFGEWRRGVVELVELLDGDGGYDPDRDRARNRLYLSPVGADAVAVSGELVGEHALGVTQAIEAEADRLWRRFRDDHRVCPELSVSSRATLRALALAELCRRAQGTSRSPADPDDPDPGATGAGWAGSAPAVDLTLVVEAADPAWVRTHGLTLRAERCGHLWCDPIVHSIIIDKTRNPLDAGRTQRFATPTQRRALAVRDRGCAFPGCDTPARWCDAHHIAPYDHGGMTDLANLVLLCRHHHGITHRHGWTLTTTSDGHHRWTTPTGTTLPNHHNRGSPDGTAG